MTDDDANYGNRCQECGEDTDSGDRGCPMCWTERDMCYQCGYCDWCIERSILYANEGSGE